MKLKISDILIDKLHEAIDPNDIIWNYATHAEMNPPEMIECASCGELVSEEKAYFCELCDDGTWCHECYDKHMDAFHPRCDSCNVILNINDAYLSCCDDTFCEGCYDQHLMDDHKLCYNCSKIIDDYPPCNCQTCEEGPFCPHCWDYYHGRRGHHQLEDENDEA